MPIFDPDSDIVTGPVVTNAPVEPVLEVNEIQGNIMPGFNTRHQMFFGLKIDAAQINAVRAWLGRLVPLISTLKQVNDFRNVRRTALRRGQERPTSPVWLNIAFDINGLRLLAPATANIRDSSFVTGMAGVSGRLGDPRDANAEGSPTRWIIGGTPESTPDIFLILAADQPDDLSYRAQELRQEIQSEPGLRIIYEQMGHVLAGEVEHFGFRDGISQVGARGRLSQGERHYLTRRYIDPDDPRALTYSRPGQPLVWPGQFVFGYERQSSEHALDPGTKARGGHDWMENGSYLVFRRLRQDVAAFRDFIANESARLRAEPGFEQITPELLAALMVGRWPKGTALSRNQSSDDPDPMADRLAVNHFTFANASAPISVCADPFVAVEDDATVQDLPEMREIAGVAADQAGLRCPFFAHIRKVNPRDLFTDQGNGSPEHTLTLQVLRRGITWGEPFPSDLAQQGQDKGQRGLLFFCYGTSIEDQFEVLNNQWMNRSIGPEGASGHDMLVGQNHSVNGAERSCVLPSSQQPQTIRSMIDWVIPTGGGFFFAPSLSAMRQFASGELS